jgi:hypothetical protein
LVPAGKLFFRLSSDPLFPYQPSLLFKASKKSRLHLSFNWFALTAQKLLTDSHTASFSDNPKMLNQVSSGKSSQFVGESVGYKPGRLSFRIDGVAMAGSCACRFHRCTCLSRPRKCASTKLVVFLPFALLAHTAFARMQRLVPVLQIDVRASVAIRPAFQFL